MTTIAAVEPLNNIEDLQKGILVPEEDMETFLKEIDWTWEQIARNDFPGNVQDLGAFQYACISNDPVLWAQFFLREPEDPDHKEPYSLWVNQKESIRYPGNTIHKTASEVGKTREIVAYSLYKACTTPGGSGLIGAPMQSHLDEIIEAMDEQLTWSPLLNDVRWHKRHKDGWKKHPHHAFYFRNGFKLDFKPSGDSGNAYRGVHARTFAIKDEACKDKNKKQWSEFWRATKPGCVAKIYSVPDGDRSCDFFKLGQQAVKVDMKDILKKEEEVKIDGLKDASRYVKSLKFRLFHWDKPSMPYPYWSDERKQYFVERYGGEDSAGYQHNVLGIDGDPENPVFAGHQFNPCVKAVPEYRGMKVLVNASQNEVLVKGYRCEMVPGDDGPVKRQIIEFDDAYNASSFFDLGNGDVESEFRRLIKTFFVSVPGLKRGGGDFGFSGDPSEIIIKSIIGKKERTVARLYMKHVTYDQQCQALDAMDDVYGPQESLNWGTDFGNAGAAVAHDLQGLPQYADKNYDDRLKGFSFGSTTDNIDEEQEPIIDAKTEKPSKITLKELSTDILVKKMQRLELEYPPDPELILIYTNHTVRAGSRNRIFKKEDDHLIDADRVCMLSKLFEAEVEDLFAV